MDTSTTPIHHGAPGPEPDARVESARILVLDRDGSLTTDIARIAGALTPAPRILRLRRPTRVVEVVEKTPVDVIVAGPDEGTPTGLRRLATVHRAHPSVVIVLAQNGRPLPPREALLTGASEVLPYPARGLKARNAVQRAVDQAETLRQEILQRDDGRHTPRPAGEASAARSAAEEEPSSRASEDDRPVAASRSSLGHVFTITSATGGCGKTFYATNFAGYLARATRSRVLLLDLDLQFGEVSVALRIRPDRTISDLVAESDGYTADLPDFLVEHEAGYHVLCAPKDPVSADRVGPREATAVIDAARRMFDYVVVDTPPALNEVVLAAFDQSQSLVVMATMDIPSLKNMGVFLQTLQRLKIDDRGVSLVLNKAEDGTGIELDHVLKLYPQGFSSVLPYAREVSRSINVGMPVVFSEPGSEVSRKLVAGARRLVEPADGAELPWNDTPTRRSLWRWLLRKGGTTS